jgi:hypothetical protein
VTASPPDADPKPSEGGPVQPERLPLADLTRLARMVATLVAPTALFSALCYFFGYSYVHWYYDYLGVSSSALGLTTPDYLIRSFDGLLPPILAAALLGLLVLWLYPVPRRWLAVRVRSRLGPRALAVLRLLPLVCGVLLSLNGLSYAVVTTPLNQGLDVAPLSLACGILLVGRAVHRRQAGDTGRVAAMACAFALVAISLFWAVSDYSADVGRARAMQLAAALPWSSRTVLYSARSLSLSRSAPGVHEVRCSDPDATYRFRYDGLVLVQQSGNQYLLLPVRWSPSNGVAILLPRNDSVHLEFMPSSARGIPLPPSC